MRFEDAQQNLDGASPQQKPLGVSAWKKSTPTVENSVIRVGGGKFLEEDQGPLKWESEVKNVQGWKT